MTVVWPEFMLHDPVAEIYYGEVDDRWADWSIMAIDGDRVLAVGHAVTFAFGEEFGRPELPDDGWDGVIMWSHVDDLEGRSRSRSSRKLGGSVSPR